MSFFQNIQHRLLKNVLYKFSLIFCSIYVVLFFGDQLKPKILFYLFISILLSVGIAGLGYVMNDIKDFKDDLKNNKPNLFNKFSKFQSVLLVVIFISLSIFPWFYLPTDQSTYYLLLIEFLLFYVYAFPPFRLKEKGFLGIITDALYAQVIPCLLAVYTFSKIANTTLHIKLIALYTIWLLLVGIRNIIKHQIEDIENDMRTNTNTFVTKNGKLATERMSYLIASSEIVIFIVLLFTLQTPIHYIIIFYFIYIVFIIISTKLNKDSMTLFNFINTRILNEFYEIHLPILLLIYFSFVQHFFMLIVLINIVFFYPIYKSYIAGFYSKYINH